MSNQKEKSYEEIISDIKQNQMDKEKLIYKEIIYTKNNSLLPMKYTYNLIIKYLNESVIKFGKRPKIKTAMRNIAYFGKILINKNLKEKVKENNNKNEEILLKYFISFNKNIWNLISKNKNDQNEKNIKENIYLSKIIQIILNIIGISYISGNINDDSFELIIKILLDFSFENISENKEDKIQDLKYMMFFNETIKFIKIIFNYFEDYSQKQKDIIKNIFIHIKNNILGSLEKNNLNYTNKYFLSKYEHKTSLLNELAYIITKIHSTEITNIFIDLLTNIYFFNFNYDNGMKPTLKLLEPLFLNLNNKNVEEIKNELEITDFTLNYINALNAKEKEVLLKDSCLIKQGFYLGDQRSYIYGDINNLENDFLILFGFRLETDDLHDVNLFEIYREGRSQINAFLRKDTNNKYELYIEDEKGINSTQVNIHIKKTYIFIFQILSKKKEIKIIYIKDSDNKSDNYIKKSKTNLEVSFGKEIKIKNIKHDNLKICIGCKREKNVFKNNFTGFIGDFIILNVLHIKDKKDKELNELYGNILKLKGDYIDLINLLLDEQNSLIKNTYYNIEYNSTFKETNKFKEKLENYEKFKSNYSISTIISPNYFKLVEHKDNIDYINLNSNNYDYYLEKIEKPFSVKYKYINANSKIKPEILNKKSLNLSTSLFNRYFHIFERKFSLIEFIKYGGIHYLSLILEYEIVL